ncbi:MULTISPECIES: DUF3429 domain-containing protein [unclassified Vibrio]|uniref:DUF3429 domain-containing protein n=1 Tax=unclassified Vibrio TaxID=2614977 RepID=UPI001F1AF828|nr:MULTISPECIES: DUF3429 domain-containing protein [unclassified Vibrio]MCF4174433.1 DUF3429 domain-containing protein [Vibrio sp. McD22-P3]USE03444.1 DUF3429 domain-containing protein [Vibrio sp. SCSIO 43133]
MIAKERLQLVKMMNWLGYLGLIPFALCIASFNANAELFGINTRIVFIAYSGIILSFLCGILWSHALSGENQPLSLPMLLLSNLICLMAWLVILIAPQQFQLALVVSMVGYICVWAVEKVKLSTASSSFPSTYSTLRNHLTLGVLVSHVIALAGS